MNEKRILVVDDEEDLCEILQFNLETAGFRVDVAYSAEDALKMNLGVYHLFLLDVMMGEISGFKMAAILRKTEATRKRPVIFLTAKDTETDKLTGFSLGADDYISKPFSIKEVIARVKAVLSRSALANGESDYDPTANPTGILQYDTLRLNPAEKTAYIGNTPVSLTKTEYELLFLLLRNPDTVFTRDQLRSEVWSGEAGIADRTVDVNITRLRKKIIPYDKCLVTRQGYGYAFNTK